MTSVVITYHDQNRLCNRRFKHFRGPLKSSCNAFRTLIYPENLLEICAYRAYDAQKNRTSLQRIADWNDDLTAVSFAAP
jgi:hypothetical protein